MTKIRIGIIGCAGIAQRMVIPAIKSLPNDFELIAISSRTIEKARQFAQYFDTLPIEGYENLLDRKDIDAIYMPLPTGLNQEWIAKALEAGKHVIAEKSLALNYEKAQQLVEFAKSKNLVLMEDFMFKYHQQHQIVWENLQNNTIGSLRLFRSQFCFPPLDEGNFRYNNNLGGGSLLDAGAYTVMASRWFLGSEQDVVSSVLHVDTDKNVDIYGNVTLQNKNGIVSQLSFGFDNFYQCNYEFLGSKGRIFAEKAFTPKPNELTHVIMETQEEKRTTNIKQDNHFVNIFKEFHSSIIEHKQESHYKDILDQSRILTKIKEMAIKIQL